MPMKIELPPVEKRISIAKTLATLLFLMYFIHAPDVVLHQLFVVVHTLYESIAIVVEELLHHTLHLSKYHSQMIVFYLTWIVILFGVYRLWQHWPTIIAKIKNRIYQQYFGLKTTAILTWKSSGIVERIKLVLIHCGLMMGTFATAMVLVA
jgi:hypothetical protein